MRVDDSTRVGIHDLCSQHAHESRADDQVRGVFIDRGMELTIPLLTVIPERNHERRLLGGPGSHECVAVRDVGADTYDVRTHIRVEKSLEQGARPRCKDEDPGHDPTLTGAGLQDGFRVHLSIDVRGDQGDEGQGHEGEQAEQHGSDQQDHEVQRHGNEGSAEVLSSDAHASRE